MGETFFIADTHFGHKNIIKFSADERQKDNKPFATIEEHDEDLVEKWNSVVKEGDKVYHLGDFCFGKANLEYAARLNGKKILIMGNHDRYTGSEYLKYFADIHGASEFDDKILTHIPVHPNQFERYEMNIHGHLHTKTLDDWRYFGVSCEQINSTPISYDVIKQKMAENSKNE